MRVLLADVQRPPDFAGGQAVHALKSAKTQDLALAWAEPAAWDAARPHRRRDRSGRRGGWVRRRRRAGTMHLVQTRRQCRRHPGKAGERFRPSEVSSARELFVGGRSLYHGYKLSSLALFEVYKSVKTVPLNIGGTLG